MKAPLPPRTALVIGVATLKEGGGFRDLNNPANDARAVSEALCDLGFDATDLGADVAKGAVTRQAIKLALYDMALTLKTRGGIGLVYFAGHGLQRGAETYLLPYDALVRFERDVSEELLPLSFVYDVLRYAGNPINIVVLDACRDDPWKQDLPVLGTPRPVDRALPTPDNVLLETSTLSGMRASDGSADMSPFAKAFVAALRLEGTDGMDLGPFLKTVNKSVAVDPKAGETPVFADTARNVVLVPTRSTFLREQAVFDNASASNNFPAMRDLVYEYNAGYFYEAARKWMADPPAPPLRPATATAAPPPNAIDPPVPPPRPRMPGANKPPKSFEPPEHDASSGAGWMGGAIARLELPDFRTVVQQTGRAPQVTMPGILVGRESLPIIFVASRPDGLDRIAQASRAAFMSRFRADGASDIEIVLERAAPKEAGGGLRGLLRQTEVLRMLHDVGVDTSATRLRTVETSVVDRDMSVTLTFVRVGAPLVTMGPDATSVSKSVGRFVFPFGARP